MVAEYVSQPTQEFYVYTHARPDGTVFYVGKGTARRAWDFSPSRRTAHHKNITAKYGVDSIRIVVFPAASEQLAFQLERAMIHQMRAAGAVLVNLTDGGEGVSGRRMTEVQASALSKGRRSWAERGINSEIRARICSGLDKGRQKAIAWNLTTAGRANTKALVAAAAIAAAKRKAKRLNCAHCGNQFETRYLGVVKWCSKSCGQQAARDGRKSAVPTRQKMRHDNSSGMTGVYWNARSSVWTAMIGVHGKLVYLGRFQTKEDAATARRLAESKYEHSVPRSRNSSL
jgi:hypothetical protein